MRKRISENLSKREQKQTPGKNLQKDSVNQREKGISESEDKMIWVAAWTLIVGCWILVVVCCLVDTGFWLLLAGSWLMLVLTVGCRVVKYQTLNVRYQALRTGCQASSGLNNH